MKTYGSEDLIYTSETIPNILKWVKPNSKVLEFGPAFGYMTRYMKEQLNCDIVCIELNSEMKPILEKYARKVIIANLDEDKWENNLNEHFDYIIFADVLEHLRNPQLVLKKAVNYGDCVLTSIPNIGHAAVILNLLDGKFSYTNIGLLDDTHIHFFTRHSIYEMTKYCGLIEIDENSTMRFYPCTTEIHTSYRRHLWTSISIARKEDSIIYQFVNCWKKAETDSQKKHKGYKLSILKTIQVITVDSTYDFLVKHKLKSNFLIKIWNRIKNQPK